MTKQQSARRGPTWLAVVLSRRWPGARGRGARRSAGARRRRAGLFAQSSLPIKSRPANCAVAEKNVLVLDTSMMDIYDGSLAQYKRNMRDRVPIILALFSEGGGKMILYRPGYEPLVAEPVPVVYQLAKSVSHSSMAVYQLVAPYVGDPSDKSWHGPMKVFRTRCQTALESLDGLNLPPDERTILETILKQQPGVHG